jgi:hypothetical protein
MSIKKNGLDEKNVKRNLEKTSFLRTLSNAEYIRRLEDE